MTSFETINSEGKKFKFDDNDNNYDIRDEMFKYDNEKIIFKKILILLITLFLVIGGTLLSIMILINIENKDNNNINNAIEIIDDLLYNNNSYFNFTVEENKDYIKAFNILDEDNDGYLNRYELLNFLRLELNNSNYFNNIDINEDNILSYNEIVTYVKLINKIDEINNMYKDLFYNDFLKIFGLDTNNFTNNYELFMEYLSILIYFDTYDYEHNGYITYNNWLNSTILIEYKEFNNNKMINQKRFKEILYGTKNYSWHRINQLNFGNNYINVFDKLDNINMTKKMIYNTSNNLYLCPHTYFNLENDINITRRRLSVQGPSYYYCWKYNLICCWYYAPIYTKYWCPSGSWCVC